MKVLVITSSLRPNSGWGRYSLEIVQNLRAKGCEVGVLVDDVQDEHSLDLEVNKIKKSNSLFNLISNIFLSRKITKKYDIVHAFDGWPYSIIGYFSVIGTKKKFFINGVGTYSVNVSGNYLKKIFLKIAYRRANRIFCISNYVNSRVKELESKADTETVFLGTSSLPLLSNEQISNVRVKFGIREEFYPIITTIGAIKYRKGQLDTLKGLKPLKDKYPNFLYIVGGSNSDEHYLDSLRAFAKENGLSSNLLIIPNLSDDELSAIYQISSFTCLNSNNDGGHFEGFGLVLIEAASFGKPSIGSRGCGIEDAIKEGYSGYLVGQKDYQGIYASAIKILEEKLIKFDNVREFASRFNWSKTVDRYIEGYNVK